MSRQHFDAAAAQARSEESAKKFLTTKIRAVAPQASDLYHPQGMTEAESASLQPLQRTLASMGINWDTFTGKIHSKSAELGMAALTRPQRLTHVAVIHDESPERFKDLLHALRVPRED